MCAYHALVPALSLSLVVTLKHNRFECDASSSVVQHAQISHLLIALFPFLPVFFWQEIGFLTPKPVVYVANLPVEAAPRSDDAPKEEINGSIEASEAREAIARVALAHAEVVTGIERDYGVPAVAACLRLQDGQEALGAKVRLHKRFVSDWRVGFAVGEWLLPMVFREQSILP